LRVIEYGKNPKVEFGAEDVTQFSSPNPHLQIRRNLLYHKTLRLQVRSAWIGLPDDPHSYTQRRIVMYAVIETGGKQYRVAPGDEVRVETLPGDVGSEVEFGRVLAVVNDSNEVTAGAAVADARVKGTISEHGRGDKVIVFKFKRKKQYKRTIGHRQNYTQVKVSEILA
jgi:large subunit ribosomal protein L21